MNCKSRTGLLVEASSGRVLAGACYNKHTGSNLAAYNPAGLVGDPWNPCPKNGRQFDDKQGYGSPPYSTPF
eukprot:2539047-Pleurochrysis_carterae.AAC.1